MTGAQNRRVMLTGAAFTSLAALATAALSAPAASAPPMPVLSDPVLALAAEREAVLAAVAPLTCRIAELGAALVRRYLPAGAPSDSWVPVAARDDAQYAEREALSQTRNHVEDRAARLMEEMLVTPATSTAGVVAKLRAALAMAAHVEADLPYEAATCLVVMRDTVRALEDRA